MNSVNGHQIFAFFIILPIENCKMVTKNALSIEVVRRMLGVSHVQLTPVCEGALIPTFSRHLG